MAMRNGPYLLVKAPADYPGFKYRGKYIYEHHLIWWRTTGSVVRDGYVIHHKNENKHDNRFENFEEITKSEHAKMHGAETAVPPVLVECDYCHGPAYVVARNYRRQIKRGNTVFCCSRSCQVKNAWKLRKLDARDPDGKGADC